MSLVETSSSGISYMAKVNEEELLNIVEKATAGAHIVFLYDSWKKKHQILFTFLKTGLSKGESAIYISFRETPEQASNAMEIFGIDVVKYMRRGFLKIIDCDPWYMQKGEVSIPRLMERWSIVVNEARMNHNKGLRVTGDMTCFIHHNRVKEMLQYEKLLRRRLTTPTMAICAYDAKQLNPELAVRLIKAHRYAIL